MAAPSFSKLDVKPSPNHIYLAAIWGHWQCTSLLSGQQHIAHGICGLQQVCILHFLSHNTWWLHGLRGTCTLRPPMSSDTAQHMTGCHSTAALSTTHCTSEWDRPWQKRWAEHTQQSMPEQNTTAHNRTMNRTSHDTTPHPTTAETCAPQHNRAQHSTTKYTTQTAEQTHSPHKAARTIRRAIPSPSP